MKKKNSRLTSFVIALCMMIGMFQSVPAFAAENLRILIMSNDDWSGYGYTVDSSWGQFCYDNWGGSGKYIYDKYDFTGDFSFLTEQMNVFGNTSDILFCYQDDNNYYKLTLGTSNSLTKVVNGTATTLATLDDSLAGIEMSVKIAHAADGTITVTRGDKAKGGEGTDIFEVVDTDLTHGKMGLSSHNSGGYIAMMLFQGTVIDDVIIVPTQEPTTEPTQEPTAAPTEAPTAAPTSPASNQVLVNDPLDIASEWHGSGFKMTEDSGQIKFEFDSEANTFGSYIYDKYRLCDDGFFWADNVKINNGNLNMLVCYHDDKNYYKITIGEELKISKVLDGIETVLEPTFIEPSANILGEEKLIKVSISGANIALHIGDAGTSHYDAEIVLMVHDDNLIERNYALKGGKVGLSCDEPFSGYFSGPWIQGLAYESSSEITPTPAPTEAPTAIPTPAPTEEPSQMTRIYEEDFNNISDSEKALWINCGYEDMQISNGTIGGADWGNSSVMLYSGKTFDDESYVYSIDVSQNLGNSTGNSGSVLFNYTAAAGSKGTDQKGYAVEIQGGDNGTVVLKKYTNTVWTGVDDIATYTHPSSLKNKNVRVEVSYTKGGTISVDLIVDGERYAAFDGVTDETFTSGYIGVMKFASAFAFDNVTVDGTGSVITPQPTAEPTAEPTTEPTAAPTEAPTAEPTAAPTEAPTAEPTAAPTEAPTAEPTAEPTEAPAPVLDDTPVITIGSVTEKAGETVTVSAVLNNNPGTLAAQLYLEYDKNALTLTDVTKGTALGSLTYTPSGTLDIYPYAMMWDGIDEDSSDGTLATFTFKINDDAKVGVYDINMYYNEGTVYDNNLEDIPLTIQKGSVNVIEYILGDLDGNTTINVRDLTFLRRFIVGGYDLNITDAAADVNRDGIINVKDSTMLSRFIVGGYGIELN